MSSLPEAVPHYRAIVSVDVEGSTTRTNPAKARYRQAMYDLFEAALEASGIARHYRDPMIDTGDGILVLIRPVDQAPKTVLLTTFVPTLTVLLSRHNTERPEHQLRMRVAVHAGDVHYDTRGCFGEALDITFRLLDAPEVKGRLSKTAGPLVLVVSDDIYRTLIRHQYDGIDDRAFEPIVRVQVGTHRHRGWIHVPSPRVPN
jgi:class 3 adenylate cyclase